jgi:hypothetical protein
LIENAIKNNSIVEVIEGIVYGSSHIERHIHPGPCRDARVVGELFCLGAVILGLVPRI